MSAKLENLVKQWLSMDPVGVPRFDSYIIFTVALEPDYPGRDTKSLGRTPL